MQQVRVRPTGYGLVLLVSSLLLGCTSQASPIQVSSVWVTLSSRTSHNLTGLRFVDSDTGWIVGAQGTILHTGDGGVTWVPQTSGVKANLMGLAFADRSHGWVVGEKGIILATRDGGQTWKAQHEAPESVLLGLAFLSDQLGWAVGFF